ncbi:hypothetical protein HNP38_003604 [Chryseobacterium defluvii]|uniref:Uncharacterized protein n=1 Tax=Chryseobacterium defluvii TaxID=160396 RepID=A0A840KN52_9FLAO|nr:hypothetical protein [Chryseobacterium defluvii]MBB4808262.1 hypothetical protein [Chryseobacterium defluvii]
MGNTDFLYRIKELEEAARKKSLEYSVIEGEKAKEFISTTLEKFKPFRAAGHLGIGSEESIILSIEENEFTFSEKYLSGPVYVFFEQDYYNKNQIFVLKEGAFFSKLLFECSQLEYFITNEKNDYLISVNWYAIEILK